MTKSKRSVARGALPKLRKFGQIQFWTDHHLRFNAVLLECDDPNYPVIAAFTYTTTAEKAQAREEAAGLLTRVVKGRVDYRIRARRVPKRFRWERQYEGNRG